MLPAKAPTEGLYPNRKNCQHQTGASVTLLGTRQAQLPSLQFFGLYFSEASHDAPYLKSAEVMGSGHRWNDGRQLGRRPSYPVLFYLVEIRRRKPHPKRARDSRACHRRGARAAFMKSPRRETGVSWSFILVDVGRIRVLPRPPAVDFQLQGQAEKGPD